MIQGGKIQHIDGLYGCVDVATQEESERLNDGIEGIVGLVIFVPFAGVNQDDVDETVIPGKRNREQREDANK